MELLREMLALQHQHGYLSDDTLRELALARNVPLYRLEGLVSFYTHFRRTPPPRTRIDLCRDVCCEIAGASRAHAELRAAAQAGDDVEIHWTSCIGRCDSAPAVLVNDTAIAPATAVDVLADFNNVHATVPNRNNAQPDPLADVSTCDPYASPAERFVTTRSLVAGEKNLGEVCIERLTAAGLRGMGGAGFPTGRKWQLVAAEPARPKYVICNADESEPGTFKDREILARLPHLVLEGVLLAALTTGAERAIIFLRHEYDRERRLLQAAIDAAYQQHAFGENACGSGQRVDVEIFVSPGGYILGEETALLEALEDKRGEPRNKPPYPGQHGLHGQPTLINNVETFALATAIVHHGADWWTAQGCDGFRGLQFVSISGDVQTPGVHLIPVGTTVRDLIATAGGMQDDKPLQAFLPGGASSRFLSAEHIDTPLDFDTVSQAGSMLGTGAVVVFSEDHNLFDIARNITAFFRNESCGKCVPCRLGTQAAVELTDAVAAGTTPAAELESLTGLASTLEQTSICGLGQIALQPLLSQRDRFPHQDA